MMEKVKLSERHACRLVGLSRSVLHYEIKPNSDNEALSARLVELAHERRRFGYRRLHAQAKREGIHANHKRIHRLYREAGLAVRRRRRHGVIVEREQLALLSVHNEVWSMDFVMDALSNNRRLQNLPPGTEQHWLLLPLKSLFEWDFARTKLARLNRAGHIGVSPGNPRQPWNWQPLNGSHVSIITACSRQLGIFRLLRPKPTTTGTKQNKP